MQPISATNLAPPSGNATKSNAFSDLGTEDFLSLMIAQLTTQDPLKPVDNQELLSQISSVRDIELSTTLTDSLRRLTGQERFGSASSLIGQFVTGKVGEGGTTPGGLVVGIRFVEDGTPVLQLSDGSELPMDQVGVIEPPARAAERLVGKAVVGLDRRTPSEPKVVRGIVTGVRADAPDSVFLELDTGKDLRLADVVGLSALETV